MMLKRILKAAGYLSLVPVAGLAAYATISAHETLSSDAPSLLEHYDFSTRPIEIYQDPTDPDRSCIRDGDREECLLRSVD